MSSCKRFWRAETIIFLGFWLALMTVGRTQLFRDPGTFWHIVVGQHILSSSELIHTDPFSFTRAGQPWIAQQWLGECVMAALHTVGGLDSVLLATATLLAGLFTWVAHRMIRTGIDPVLTMLFVALAMMASTYHFHPRPHVLTMVFLAWTFAWLCDFESGRIRIGKLFWLVPVYVVWTNVHGGMVTGVATIALAVTGWGLAKLLRKESPIIHYRQLLPLGVLVLACALTAFVNPYGMQMQRVWFGLIGSPVLPRLIEEHAPLLSGSSGWLVISFAVFYLIALVGVLPKWPRVTWLIPLFWFVSAWSRIRNGPFFSITAAIALADMFPHIRWAGWLARHGSRAFRLRPALVAEPGLLKKGSDPVKFKGSDLLFNTWRPALIPAVVVLASLVLETARVPVPILGADWVKLDRQHWPVDLLPELRAYEKSHPSGTPIFNDMLYGGFLIYYTPGLRVFIDDRCELYGDDGLLAYAQAMFEDPGQIEVWQKQYGFEAALVATGSEFDRYLSSAQGWSVVRRTETAALYERE